jgi:nucleoside-diphosphate-sugar epimerase
MMSLSSIYRGKKILVTGGCGFIGSYVAFKLLELGADVTIFDLNPVELDPRIHTIRGDVCDFERLSQATQGQQYIFHLAAILGVEKILDIPLQVLRVNLGGTINALRAATENRVDRFVYASSSEVYGQPRKIPIAEDDLTSPISTYGISKIAAESYCSAYHREYGLKYTIARFFNVYGPGQTEKFVMPIFISRVMQGLSPVIYGEGSQSRSYTYITDAVHGILLAGASDKGIAEVFNIGNDEEISINELARFIIEISGNNLEPIYRPFGDGIRIENREILRRQPDISKASSVLGFRITIPWQEGVRRFRQWYTENQNATRLSKSAGYQRQKASLGLS